MMRSYYDIRNKFLYWLTKKLLPWGYPCWDYAHLMQLISDWTKVASEHTAEYDRHNGAEKHSIELLIVSEYADRLANGGAWDQIWNTVDYKPLQKEWKLEAEYMDALFHRIKRKGKSW